MMNSADDFNDWMNIYCELENDLDAKRIAVLGALKPFRSLEELYTLYYVTLEEVDLEEVILEKIENYQTGIEEWAEIFMRIPRKEEFSKIREIFISKMSKLVKK